MNDDDIDWYLWGLYEKYKEDKQSIGKMLEEVREKLLSVRDISIQFSIEEIHDLHMCIAECIHIHESDKEHEKECPRCKSYSDLYKRIVVLCDCIDKGRDL